MEQDGHQWHRIYLTEAQVQQGLHQQIMAETARSFQTDRRREGFWVFCTQACPAGEMNLFFAPNASFHLQKLIQKFDGIPCTTPAADMPLLGLLMADDAMAAWESLSGRRLGH